ncbi:hypothetical protein EWM64_g9637 [Hericium alpestre]|uniref:Peptide hydrolase n=1 Tax=Hericium alpestre TaxID=135208 RepID=A0A4Y9ZI17_9AGAM|nr:hypothetical protein EWM64_g9637 [Hericium alpestre]
MGEPLSPELTHQSPSVVSALNTCRNVEANLMRQCSSENSKVVNADLERHLVYVRILGYLLVYGPSITAETWVAKCIHSCKDDDELLDLGPFFDQHLLASCMHIIVVFSLSYNEMSLMPVCKHKKGTPVVSRITSRPSFNRLQDFIKANLVKSPQSHSEARKSALLRDNFRCVISGCIDHKIYMKHPELIPDLHDNMSATECCHIISQSTNDFAVVRVGDKIEYAANVWTIFNYFGCPEMLNDLAGMKVHSMANVLTMETTLHDLFDTLNLWLEETNVLNRYKVKFVPLVSGIIRSKRVPEVVELTSADPDLALPSPVYLRLHAACCKVAQMSGAAQYHDRIDRETEDFDPMFATEEEFSTLLNARLHDLAPGHLVLCYVMHGHPLKLVFRIRICCNGEEVVIVAPDHHNLMLRARSSSSSYRSDLSLSITARPPALAYSSTYHSRANERVREYILQRVNGIEKGHAHVEVDDDVRTSANIIDGAHAAHFEGSNILVKIDGWDNSSEASALLFSAHFDSVSTVPGVIDDGMAAVALLQMLSYLTAHGPRRTAIFNLNNGEEDGLHGAHAFLQHPCIG